MNKEHIREALAAICTGPFLQTAKNLLATLGYRSDLTEAFSGTACDFIETFPAFNRNTQTEQALRNHAASIHFIFQLTDAEIDAETQQRLELFEENDAESFFFFAVELKEKTYSRGAYAELTRELNKRLIVPTVVLFRVSTRLTLGFVGRRPHAHHPGRDVLQQVTLIKEIRLEAPHRAHLDILSELSLTECLKWMDANKKQKNLAGLLSAWVAKLNTEALNKQFYGRLFSWFEWAVRESKFPRAELNPLGPEEHIIRLITRLLFIWFLKEKGLVPEWLFEESGQSEQVSLQNNAPSEESEQNRQVSLQNNAPSEESEERGRVGLQNNQQSEYPPPYRR